jgi:signal peptidase II
VSSANPKPDIPNPQAPAYRSSAAIALFLLTMVFGLGLDLWSKSYAWNELVVDPAAPLERDPFTGHLRVESETATPIPGWLHFKVTVNEGAVFGLGQGNQTLFAVVSVLAIGCLTWFFATSGGRRFYQFILGMLLAGVLGNLYDRMVYHHVRDMLYALPDRTWPGTWTLPLVNYPGPGREVFPWIFNVADTLLCAGVGLMIVYSVFFAQDPQREPDAKDEPAAQPARS